MYIVHPAGGSQPQRVGKKPAQILSGTFVDRQVIHLSEKIRTGGAGVKNFSEQQIIQHRADGINIRFKAEAVAAPAADFRRTESFFDRIERQRLVCVAHRTEIQQHDGIVRAPEEIVGGNIHVQFAAPVKQGDFLRNGLNVVYDGKHSVCVLHSAESFLRERSAADARHGDSQRVFVGENGGNVHAHAFEL